MEDYNLKQALRRESSKMGVGGGHGEGKASACPSLVSSFGSQGLLTSVNYNLLIAPSPPPGKHPLTLDQNKDSIC